MRYLNELSRDVTETSDFVVLAEIFVSSKDKSWNSKNHKSFKKTKQNTIFGLDKMCLVLYQRNMNHWT